MATDDFPEQALEGDRHTDPLTGRWTPDRESKYHFGHKEKKPEPKPDPYDGWRYEG